MIRSGHRGLARSFNLCYQYTDDLIVFNNKKFLDYLKEVYPFQLTIEKANKSDHPANYLDLTFTVDSGGKLSTRLHDTHDDFDFHIVNFPFLSSNIQYGPSYTFCSSQEMQDAAHIRMILDIAASVLTDFCGLRSCSRDFMADIKILLRDNISQSRKW